MAGREYPDRNKRTEPALGSGFDASMRKDKKGRIGVNPSRKVHNLGTGADLPAVIAKINELLQSQRDSKQMDGGR